MSTDTKEVEAKWAAHIKSGFESLLSQDEVKNLEAVLGEEGMRRAIESDTMLSSEHFQRHYAATTILILNDRGLLPLDAATRDFLKNYTRLDTGQDVVAKDRELRKTKTTTAPKAKRGLKRARSLGDLYVAEVKHRKRYRREELVQAEPDGAVVSMLCALATLHHA
ncbi:hypothetical protein C8Q70DRAFT_1057927 [Cubamyces menziesii]|nr:hypothetical protein C8Q70DRAFT_1057927 [Cubamyces menziesii]